MRYKMKNETLTAEIESFGAELKSIKSNATGVEYMWYGKPEYYKNVTDPVSVCWKLKKPGIHL